MFYSRYYKNIQYVIIDGNSKDKTKSIINKYLDKIDIFKSEEDNGIYDAFNKGLELAKGDLVGFVNSGDTLTKDFMYFAKILSKLQKC